jgi:hypothetical protein
MKHWFTAGLFLFCPSLRGEIDADRMVRALVQIEGGHWGDNGGAAHMQYAAWSDRTVWPYYQSRSEPHARLVYGWHLAWVCKELTRYGIKVTPKSVGLVWRYGLEGAKRRKFEGEYGDRLSALYFDLTP